MESFDDDYEAVRLGQELDAKIQMAMLKMDSERFKHEVEREKREKLRRQQDSGWKTRLLEAAFEGDNFDINKVFKELAERDYTAGIRDDEVSLMIKHKHMYDLVNCADTNGNTPLSEASAGGRHDTVNLLIQNGADPNSRGYFRRTPLYRAAFCGHLETCQVLLRNGADPRLYADDGQTPDMVAALPSIQFLLRSWDLSVTDSMLETISISEKLSESQRQQIKGEEGERLRQLYIKSQVEWNKQYNELVKAQHKVMRLEVFQESGNEIDTDDLNVALEVPWLCSKELKTVEVREQFCRVRMDDLYRKFSTLKIRLPDITEDQVTEIGKLVCFRDLDDGLMRDTDGSIEASKKWPLVIDPTDQTSIFLRYCDTNYLDSYIPRNMEPEMIRKAIIGGLRYGKPVVIDLQGTDMFDAVQMKFDEVMSGLMDDVLSKEIMKPEKYMSLVRESDGSEYQSHMFIPQRLVNFKFIFLTKSSNPPSDLVKRTFPIRVTVTYRGSRTSRSSGSSGTRRSCSRNQWCEVREQFVGHNPPVDHRQQSTSATSADRPVDRRPSTDRGSKTTSS